MSKTAMTTKNVKSSSLSKLDEDLAKLENDGLLKKVKGSDKYEIDPEKFYEYISAEIDSGRVDKYLLNIMKKSSSSSSSSSRSRTQTGGSNDTGGGAKSGAKSADGAAGGADSDAGVNLRSIELALQSQGKTQEINRMLARLEFIKRVQQQGSNYQVTPEIREELKEAHNKYVAEGRLPPHGGYVNPTEDTALTVTGLALGHIVGPAAIASAARVTATYIAGLVGTVATSSALGPVMAGAFAGRLALNKLRPGLEAKIMETFSRNISEAVQKGRDRVTMRLEFLKATVVKSIGGLFSKIIPAARSLRSRARGVVSAVQGQSVPADVSHLAMVVRDPAYEFENGTDFEKKLVSDTNLLVKRILRSHNIKISEHAIRHMINELIVGVQQDMVVYSGIGGVAGSIVQPLVTEANRIRAEKIRRKKKPK